uniref:NADP oxidoreductase, coenzyme F420-dependent n=1 Tax=Solibacter usitatus (strain Ellin6076) TaxID=234267 RepID=Q022I0_SOLUE
MRIGIIGSGNVGGTLGRRWASNGHTVFFATRDPQSAAIRRLLAESGPTAAAGSLHDAVAQSDLVLLATPWPATRQMLEAAGDFGNRILIDATNPVAPDLSGLECANTTSGAESVAQWAPTARVVKAFNTVGNNVMADPAFPAPVALFYCGDNASAKQTVAPLIRELGFDAIDAGPLSQARVLEPFALLWISLAVKSGYGREIAFQFMRR